MKKRTKSKRKQQLEDDLLFYLDYWNKFPSHFRTIVQKEVDDLQERIKNE